MLDVYGVKREEAGRRTGGGSKVEGCECGECNTHSSALFALRLVFRKPCT